MKTLTLAAVAVVALLGFLSGCDESQTMMEQVTREVTPAPEETVPVEEAQPTPEEEVAVEETPPAPEEETLAETFPARRGEVTLAETACDTDFCLVGISYTNDANPDNTGQLTIYFDIPEALGPGPHRVFVRYQHEFLQTDIPVENTQFVRRLEPGTWVDYTEAAFVLDADDKIVFRYQIAPRSDSVRIVIGDAISGDAPGAVPVGEPPIDPDWDGEGQYYERSFEIYSTAPPMEEAPRVLRGEKLVRATACQDEVCLVGVSYTNDANPDGSGQLTLYFDIPEALGPGPHRVLVRHYTPAMETDIPFENKQIVERKEPGETFFTSYTEAIVFLDADDKIVFNYRISSNFQSTWVVIGDAISGDAPGAVSFGDPNQYFPEWIPGTYPYWEGEEQYNELNFTLVGGEHPDFHRQ